MINFSFREWNLELRSCGKQLLQEWEHNTAEILQWFTRDKWGEYCIVIAYWIETSEGFDLKFVGWRPFSEHVDNDVFFLLAKRWHNILSAI